MIITEDQLKEFAIKNGFNYEFDGKLNMSYVEIPEEFNLCDNDQRFVVCDWKEDKLECMYAYEFVYFTSDNTYGVKTTYIKDIDTLDEAQNYLDEFKVFYKLCGEFSSKYKEQIKLVKIGGDF